ncbi:DUF58 domain-containing protein [Halorussus salinus]|uniref:DUF58 domain-containing protein n=1 Tax=Halorussus salinus TaxID=1364935 RepID=UPI0010920E1C|nr:DUF58 domain-containing protein [Halorussus salinus]
MQVTRRYWTAVGLIGFLLMAAVVLSQPLLLVGGAGLGAWLLAQQYLFAWSTHQLADELRVTQTVARDRIMVEEPLTCGLTATIPDVDWCSMTVTIEAGVPLGATGDGATHQQRRLTQAVPRDGEPEEAATAFTVRWPVAGRVTFENPTVTITDTQSLFRTTVTKPAVTPPSVTVVPPQPRALHIGAGGDPTTAIIGNHPTNQEGMGLDPDSIREYTPGDALRQIDWKATARSSQPYIRTFEKHTEYGTALILDHREAMQVGTPGETKLEYARQVALAVVDQAETDGDSIGLHTIGDAGVTNRQPIRATMETYATLRTTIYDVTPTEDSNPTAQQRADRADQRAASMGVPDSTPQGDNHSTTTPGIAKQTADELAREDSAFAASLHPFYTAAQTYVQRIATKPLYQTVRTLLTTGENTEHRRPDRIVIVTDDTNRAEVRETVQVARQQSDQVLVFLTPTVLFEPAGLTDMESAYERYTEFEQFRQQLAGLDQVSAFEVAPGDRLATLQKTASATTPITSR